LRAFKRFQPLFNSGKTRLKGGYAIFHGDVVRR